MTLLAKNITLSYQRHEIITNLDLEINPNEITAIIGPNGCGKSTLLRGLTCLLAPAEGEVTLDGKPTQQWAKKTLAKRIAILPQNPSAPEGLTVKQLVEHGRFAHQGLFSKPTLEDVEIVNWAMQQTSVIDYQARLFSTLSGGERQRAWIALALAQKAKILFLDEPTTFLDIGHQLEVMELLKELNQSHNIGIVMVLHDINQAGNYADRLIAMKQGCIVADGKAQEIITPELIKKLFNATTKIINYEHDGQQKSYCIPVSI
ncbi:MAG: ABC transporter ATP-binding protein [Hyphomicrobiales bacterium]